MLVSSPAILSRTYLVYNYLSLIYHGIRGLLIEGSCKRDIISDFSFKKKRTFENTRDGSPSAEIHGLVVVEVPGKRDVTGDLFL